MTENQNKILEATVAERTQELSKKHEELNKEHQIVTESINYAQIIQNGQLPRDHRVEGDLNLSTLFGNQEIRLVVTYGGFQRQG